MKSIFYVFLFICGFSQIGWASNCPTTGGETSPCENEQADLDAALLGLEVATNATFCLKASTVSDGEGIQCRSSVRYKNSGGTIVDDVFEDRFVFSETDRLGIDRIFFVKQASGKYNIYTHSNYGSGSPVVNRHHPLNIERDVTFNGLLPTFNIFFFIAGQPPTPDDYFTAEYWETHVDLIDTNGVAFKRYHNLNPIQE